MPRCGGTSLAARVPSLLLNKTIVWLRFLQRKRNKATKIITASPATLPTTPPTTVGVETGGPLLSATLPAAAVLEDAGLELVVAPTPPPIMIPPEVDAGWKDEKVVKSSEDDADDEAMSGSKNRREELEDVRARTARDGAGVDCLIVEVMEAFEEV